MTITGVTFNKSRAFAGEPITATMKLNVASGDYAVNGYVNLHIFLGATPYDGGMLAKELTGISIAKGASKWVSFSFEFPNMTEYTPDGGSARLYSFGVYVEAQTSNGFNNASKTAAGSCVTQRINPVIDEVLIDDELGELDYFGGYVQSKTTLSFDVSATLDPVDTSLTAIFSLGVVVNGASVYGANNSTGNFVLPIFSTFGAGTWTLTVADSTGRTAITDGSFTVFAYSPPSISLFTVRRYSSYVDDQNVTQYVESDDGDHVWVNAAAVVTTIASLNGYTLTLKYKEHRELEYESVLVDSYSDGRTILREDDRTIVSGLVPPAEAYDFELVLTDWFGTTTSYSVVTKAEAIMHIGNYGVAFGGYSTATENDKKEEFYNPIVPYGGIVDPEWTVLELENGFTTQDTSVYKPLSYRKIGNHVFIRGHVFGTWTGTRKIICYLPYTPSYNHDVWARCAGTNIAGLLFSAPEVSLSIYSIYALSNGALVTTFSGAIDCFCDYWTD